MFHFLFIHIRSHVFRSLSMFFVSLLTVFLVCIFFFLYQNSVKALKYYNYDIVDIHRFTLTRDSNYFDMFSHTSQGIPMDVVRALQEDPRIRDIQAYSLVEIPVLAKFSLFEFGLETDIPIFAVTDSALIGSGARIGISRALIDFYNLKFAGSSQMFPKIPEAFIRGQSVKMTFGASKIFPPLPKIADPIDARIVQIDENFPGFGLTLPESIVREKMQQVGYELSPPYKVIAFLKDIADVGYIREKYKNYRLEIDIVKMEKLQNRIYLLGYIFLGITLVVSGFFIIFFGFLLAAFFRERRDIFRMVSIFGLTSFRARLLTIAEPMILILIGVCLGGILGYYSVSWMTQYGSFTLSQYGINFDLSLVSMSYIMSICVLLICTFFIMVLLLEYSWRKKILLR